MHSEPDAETGVCALHMLCSTLPFCVKNIKHLPITVALSWVEEVIDMPGLFQFVSSGELWGITLCTASGSKGGFRNPCPMRSCVRDPCPHILLAQILVRLQNNMDQKSYTDGKEETWFWKTPLNLDQFPDLICKAATQQILLGKLRSLKLFLSWFSLL